ncbi:hypothetical protein MTO96_043902, partial [Rhipicephalus appendiculatus]
MDDKFSPSSLSGFTISGSSKRSRAFELLLREANNILRQDEARKPLTSPSSSQGSQESCSATQVQTTRHGCTRRHKPGARTAIQPWPLQLTRRRRPQPRKPLLPSWLVLPPKSAILTPRQIPANKPRWNRK